MTQHLATRGVDQRSHMRRLVVALCIALSLPTTAVQLFGPSADKSDYVVHLAVIDHLQHGQLDVAHFVFHAAVAALGFVLGNAAATLLVIALAQIALGVLAFRVLCDAFEAGSHEAASAARWAFAATAALLICGPINVLSFPRLYLGFISTAAYHSPTIQILKPLALLLFLRLSSDVLDGAAAQRSSRGLLGLAVLTILTTMAKPSFSIVVVPALAATALVYRRSVPVRRTLATLAVLGVSVGLVIVWQGLFLFSGRVDDSAIRFRPLVVASVFEPVQGKLAIKLLLSLAFPLVALIGNPRAALADRRLVFSYICLLVSLAYYLLLAETGPRLTHGNFLWGVMVSLFLVFVSTAAMLARDGASAPRATRAAWLTLAVHFVCGVVWLAAANGVLGALCNDGYANWCW